MEMVEEVKYKVLKKIGKSEIRRYPDLILAVTEMKGDLYSSNEEFMKLFEYISGSNKKKEKISMTSPVTTWHDSGVLTMAFVMPSNFSLKNLPLPSNKSVKIIKRKKCTMAVLRFSGFVNNRKLIIKRHELIEEILKADIKIKGRPLLMRYNSPWTLPFLRRNEIGIEVSL
jgi:effector-binding domain-containing protein